MNSERTLTAVGSHIFAGGFTIGIEKHFKVLAHLEDGNYGVDTFKLNRPNIPVYTDYDSWPVDELREVGVSMVYANPPCALFSSAGMSIIRGQDNWKTDPRQQCIHKCFGLLKKLNPDVLAIESVTRAFTLGRPLFDALTLQALTMGYSVTHLLVNASYLGAPQVRRRYFFIVHRFGLQVPTPNWAPPATVRETLASVGDPGFARPVRPDLQKYYEMLAKLDGPNKGIRTLWERDNPPETHIITPNGVKGRPRMMEHRIPIDKPMGAYIGDFCIHPTEPRNLGLEEAKALCCFPPDWKFACNPKYAFSELARGVLPPVAEWLGGVVKSAILSESSEHGNVYQIDIREPSEGGTYVTKLPIPIPQDFAPAKPVVLKPIDESERDEADVTDMMTPQDAPLPVITTVAIHGGVSTSYAYATIRDNQTTAPSQQFKILAPETYHSVTGVSGATVMIVGDRTIKQDRSPRDQKHRLRSQSAFMGRMGDKIFPRIHNTLSDGYVMETLCHLDWPNVNTKQVLVEMKTKLSEEIWCRPVAPPVDWVADIVAYITARGFAGPLKKDQIDDVIKNHVFRLTDLKNELTPCEIHGDPTLDNVMARGDGALVITDPLPWDEGSMPPLRAVDLGKMLQSALGYESVIRPREFKPGDLFENFNELGGVILEGESVADSAAAIIFCMIHFVRLLPYQPPENREPLVGILSKFLDLMRTRTA